MQGDVVEAAKGLRDFSRANPFLVIKGGVLDGKVMNPDEIAKLADLESREVLLAKLAGAMKASMANAAATFAALPVQMARLLAALEAKQAEQAGGAESQSAADGAGRRGQPPTARKPPKARRAGGGAGRSGSRRQRRGPGRLTGLTRSGHRDMRVAQVTGTT